MPACSKRGGSLASWHQNVVVKIPIDATGSKRPRILSKEGIKINMTLIFSANQALLAALAGATYVSPFVGRLDDAGQDGMEVVRAVGRDLRQLPLPAQVLAASIRTAPHVIQAALAGSHVATLPYSILQQMMKHPLTDVGIERFLADSRKYAAV